MAKRWRYKVVVAPAGHLWFCVAVASGDWHVCYRVIGREGRPVVAEMKVLAGRVNVRPDGEPVGDPEPNGEGITASLLKDEVAVAQHIYEVLPAALRKKRDGAFPELFAHFVGGLVDPDRKPRRGKRGPKGWPDEEYVRLAAEYIERCATSRRPVVEMAAAHDMTDGAVRGTLNRARRRGLLTRQTAGRAGGQLTPRAKRILRRLKRRKGGR